MRPTAGQCAHACRLEAPTPRPPTVWPLLLDLMACLQAHPRPGVHLRQVELPGLHSKFIESQRSVLAELFDHCLMNWPEIQGTGLCLVAPARCHCSNDRSLNIPPRSAAHTPSVGAVVGLVGKVHVAKVQAHEKRAGGIEGDGSRRPVGERQHGKRVTTGQRGV